MAKATIKISNGKLRDFIEANGVKTPASLFSKLGISYSEIKEAKEYVNISIAVQDVDLSDWIEDINDVLEMKLSPADLQVES